MVVVVVMVELEVLMDVYGFEMKSSCEELVLIIGEVDKGAVVLIWGERYLLEHHVLHLCCRDDIVGCRTMLARK